MEKVFVFMRFTFSTKDFEHGPHDREMASNGSNNASSASANPKTQRVVSPKPVELFPFALRARIVATGEQTLKAIRKKDPVPPAYRRYLT